MAQKTPQLDPGESIVFKGMPFNHFSLLMPSGKIVGSCLSTPIQRLAGDRLREDTKMNGGIVVRIAYSDRANYWDKEWSMNC